MTPANNTGGFVQEFKDFIMKGNVLDLAVAVIIGGAFGKIVSGFVENIIMPIVALFIPGGEWRQIKIVLGTIPDPKNPGKFIENALLIGQFLGALVDFLIVAFVIFLIVKTVNKFKRKQEREAAAAPDLKLLAEERLTESIDRLNQTIESKLN